MAGRPHPVRVGPSASLICATGGDRLALVPEPPIVVGSLTLPGTPTCTMMIWRHARSHIGDGVSWGKARVQNACDWLDLQTPLSLRPQAEPQTELLVLARPYVCSSSLELAIGHRAGGDMLDFDPTKRGRAGVRDVRQPPSFRDRQEVWYFFASRMVSFWLRPFGIERPYVPYGVNNPRNFRRPPGRQPAWKLGGFSHSSSAVCCPTVSTTGKPETPPPLMQLQNISNRGSYAGSGR